MRPLRERIALRPATAPAAGSAADGGAVAVLPDFGRGIAEVREDLLAELVAALADAAGRKRSPCARELRVDGEQLHLLVAATLSARRPRRER